MGGAGHVVAVGLGPGRPDLVNRATTEAIARVPRRFVRTLRHPSAGVVEGATSFDDVYESASTLDECYRAIVERLVEAARGDTVLYAVPGSPLVAERTVELLLDDDRVDVDVVPAMSFLDLAWLRLGVDPLAAGVRIVDGQRFAVEAAGEHGPLLVAQCDSPLVLADVMSAIDDAVSTPDHDVRPRGGEREVVVLQHLGLEDERVRTVAVRDLVRTVEPDHLTTLWVPELAAPIAGEVQRFAELVATLRRECPWDREQTHRSLTRHLLEETYEVLEAIDGVDTETGEGYEHLEEELGDLLFQVLFHSTLAAEAGQFTLADVARGIHEKLYLRHPHVFGEVEVAGADDVVRNWEQIKKAEKGRESVFEGIPKHLPALLYALKVQKKVASLEGVAGTADTLQRIAELLPSTDPTPEGIGELLFATVDLARRHNVDPEAALRAATDRRRAEAEARETGSL